MSKEAGRRTAQRRRSECASAADSAAIADAAPRLGVRLRACVVMARVRGFTQVAARLEPTRVVHLLDEFFGSMTDVAVAQRAMIDALLGEAMVLFFGIPSPRRDDPLRAVRTALEMQRAFLALRNRWLATGQDDLAQLGLAVGLSAGEVLIGHVRPATRLAYTAVGEPLHTAAALCAAARDAETLIDEAAHASASVRLDSEVIFTARALGGRGRDARTAYRVQPLRGGLRVVPARPVQDPVCGSVVDPRRAVRDGDRYFCSAACARRFAAALDS
jgi:class 3 adenylate cyclase